MTLEKIKNEKNFILLFFVINFLIAILNKNSQMMGGVLDYYNDFKEIITHNFNLKYSKMNSPAFPMWGYGWIFTLTNNKIYIFIIQFFFSLYANLNLIFYLNKYENFTKKQIQYFKYILLISFSFIAVTYTLSPYSIAINLLILSILYFIKSFKVNNKKYKIFFIIYSSIFFGLLLNFRSDYIYFTFILPLILFYIKPSSQNIYLGFLWLIITFSFLIPWMIYTNYSIGKPLLTSTNSGHVFFIGLGNLPNNKWKITTSDQDSQMYILLNKKFGKNTSSLRFNEDIYLKKKFIEYIKKDPIEYLKKVLYSSYKTVTSGIYVPEFFNILDNCSSLGCKYDFISDLNNKPISSLLQNSNKTFIYLITYFGIIIGIIIILLSYLLLPYLLYKSLVSKEFLLLVSIFVILYQLIINSFAFQMKLYSTYSYIWSLIMILYFIKIKNIKNFV